MKVSVIIPNRNGRGVLDRCLDALQKAGAVGEILVVDDGSTDGSDREASKPGIRVLRSPKRGFAAAVNHGARAATGTAFLILNSDAFVRADTVKLLARTLEDDERLGICAAALVDEKGAPTRSFGRLLDLSTAMRAAWSVPQRRPRAAGRGVQRIPFVPLACVLIRRSAWAEVEGLDERFFFYFEDHDLCWRMACAGWEVALRWDAIAAHVGGASSQRHEPQIWFQHYHESRLLYLRKRYPSLWVAYSAVWIPSAAAHAVLWLARAAAPGTREPALRWAIAYMRSAFAGVIT